MNHICRWVATRWSSAFRVPNCHRNGRKVLICVFTLDIDDCWNNNGQLESVAHYHLLDVGVATCHITFCLSDLLRLQIPWNITTLCAARRRSPAFSLILATRTVRLTYLLKKWGGRSWT